MVGVPRRAPGPRDRPRGEPLRRRRRGGLVDALVGREGVALRPPNPLPHPHSPLWVRPGPSAPQVGPGTLRPRHPRDPSRDPHTPTPDPYPQGPRPRSRPERPVSPTAGVRVPCIWPTPRTATTSSRVTSRSCTVWTRSAPACGSCRTARR